MPHQTRKPLGQGLKCLADLHEWECKNIPFLQVSSARALYFTMIQRFLFEPPEKALPLKKFQACQTDRVARMRIQEFEKMGLVTVSLSNDDGRTKTLAPTKKFFELIDVHTLQMQAKFSERFHIIKKDDSPKQTYRFKH